VKGTFAIVLMVCSPFIVGGLFILGLKAMEAYRQWKYEQAVKERNAKLLRHSITPFRGVKGYQYDDQH